MAEEKNITLQQLLTKHFVPATGKDENANYRSTGEVFTLLDDHAPGLFSSTEMYAALVNAGFQDSVEGGELVWCMAPHRSVRIVD